LDEYGKLAIFSEKSTNLKNFFIKLFDDGCAIMLLEAGLTRKFVADLWRSNALFRVKCKF
jgi:hypothetical protein